MQETLLRVFMVALSLIVCPRDEPGVEDWDDIRVSVQNHEGNLLREEEELHLETASVREEITLSGKERRDDIRNILQEQNHPNQPVTEQDKSPNTTVIGQHNADQGGRRQRFTAELDPNLSQHYNEKDSGLKTSQVTRKQNANYIQTDVPFREPDGPQGQHEETDKDKLSSGGTEGLLSHVYATSSENETVEEDITDWEECLWYIWNTFSIISIVHFLRKYHSKSLQNNQKNFPVLCTVADVTIPDINTLQKFYTKCSQAVSEKKWEGEFLGGFVDDLFEAMRKISAKTGGMVLRDFQNINRREIIVPFTPPEPYSFRCYLSNDQTSDFSTHMQACGQIKVVEKIRNRNGCPCQSSDADDMVCLLHGDNEKVKTTTVDACNGPFCFKSTPFLSKSQINRWFQNTIKLAWGLISHKYEFELSFCSIDVLTIRFRSGKKISFKMKPVVKSNDAHFSITPWPSDDPDSLWTLSLATYEDQLLQYFSKQLPENSCHLQVLEMALFLHRRQKVLTGSSTLKEFHFKTALLHLLLSKDPAQWKPDNIASRLQDFLGFIESSIEKRLLNHALVGNPLTVIDLPAEFTRAKPVNLFHPLVVHECMHKNAAAQFQEMLRNTPIIIHEYTSESTQVETADQPHLQFNTVDSKLVK